MKIVPTFATQNRREGLFAIHLDGETKDELSKCFDFWLGDTEVLFNFFSAHINDLNSGHYKRQISIQEAIRSTRNQARHLFKIVKELAITGVNQGERNLSSVFESLDNNEYRLKELQLVKGKPTYLENWLRIYAIKVDANTFIVTGGAIKLVKKIEHSQDLILEKRKLEDARSFLQDVGIIDQEEFEVYILSYDNK